MKLVLIISRKDYDLDLINSS